jgi:hypothetical protein
MGLKGMFVLAADGPETMGAARGLIDQDRGQR